MEDPHPALAHAQPLRLSKPQAPRIAQLVPPRSRPPRQDQCETQIVGQTSPVSLPNQLARHALLTAVYALLLYNSGGGSSKSRALSAMLTRCSYPGGESRGGLSRHSRTCPITGADLSRFALSRARRTQFGNSVRDRGRWLRRTKTSTAVATASTTRRRSITLFYCRR